MLTKAEKIAFYCIAQQNMGCSFDEWATLTAVKDFDSYFEAVRSAVEKELFKSILDKCQIKLESISIKVEEISSFYGCLTLKEEENKYFWGIPNHFDILYKEIPESLYLEICKHIT